MKVLGVIGSPRRGGNTQVLVETILSAAAEAGAETELIALRELNIRDCDGCHACWRGRPCAKQDDMNGLFPRIAASEAIVFGTPVYWYGPTAGMKAFLDRFVYFNCPENRVKIRGHLAALAVPFEEEDPAAAAPLTAMFEQSLKYLEMRYAGRVLAPGLRERGEVRRRPECLAACRELGRKLVEG